MKARLATPKGTHAWLRIYWGDSQAHDCPAFGYHNAMKLLGETMHGDYHGFLHHGVFTAS